MRKKLMSVLIISLLGLSFSLGAFGNTAEAASYTSEVGIEFVGKMPEKTKPTTPTTRPTTTSPMTPTTSQVTPDGKTPVLKNAAKGQTSLPQTSEMKESGLSMMGLILLLAMGLVGWFKRNYAK